MNCPHCKTPIDEHEAGPETDACVVVIVFGREECPVHQSLWCCSKGRARYSQKIDDAWKVVNKIREKDIDEQYKFVDILYGIMKNRGLPKGALMLLPLYIDPLAICRAVLKAVVND